MTDARQDCIFCKIASGELGTTFVVESDNVVAFDDISPQAPTHVLVIPKEHVENVHALQQSDAGLWAEMLQVVRDVAEARGVQESGYRIVSNAGPDSGQEVPHVHIHVLGGKKLGSIA
jgi:histidine triad (HIT) family protein